MKLSLWNAFLGLFALAAAAVLGYAFWPKPIAVDLAEVTRGPLRVSVDEDGKTRIRDRYIVSAPLAGRLARIQLDSGDPIEAGKTLLAVIEPGDPELLDAREVAQAEARVKAAEVAHSQAAPMLEKARAELDFAESNLARVQRLAADSALASGELDEAKRLFRTRTEEYKAARFAEEIARFELAQAQAALLRSRPDGEDVEFPWRFEIRAPITGQVLRVFQESSAVVAAGTQLIEVGDSRDLEVEIDVLSSDAVKITPGDAVLLEHWGGEKPLRGVVRVVEPSAFTKLSALGVEEQRVNVIVDFVDPIGKRGSLGDAYRVDARIIVWEGEDVLQVPTSALFRKGNEWAVFRDDSGVAALRTVEIGRRNPLEVEIVSGLEAGDRVIIYPSDRIEDGASVVSR
ncbi:MAG: HlyD family efflux transporter periplasmic adaptor subunit [Pirellulaceae bacterium]